MSLELAGKEILESGDIHAFETFVVTNAEKINMKVLFEERTSFLIILVQTLRKAETLVIDRSYKVMIEDYKNCVIFLVETGCDINAQDDLGRTFAHWTILLHSLELLAIALGLGYNTLIQDCEGETIVHLSIRYNDQMALETIKLYSNNPEVFEAPSETSGATPLIYAVQIGAADILKKLLQLSVKVDAQENNKYKRTALHYALFTDNEEIFKILLKHKAKSDIKDYKDKSVIDRVAEHPKDSFLRIITQYSSSDIFSPSPNNSANAISYSPIIIACKNADFHMLCDLINKEKDQSAKLNLLVEDSELRTPLHHCVDNPDTKCAEKLIELEPELIKKKDKNGFTVLHLATIANNVKLVQLLIRKGCDIKEKDNDGHTSFHWGVVCCAVELIDIFLKTDPEIISIVDNHGASPFHYATQSFLSPEGSVQGPIIIERLLRDNKDDINCVDFDNRTPLLWAASLGITDCCQILLENGADINHKDSNGLSILHCAASRGHYDIIDLVVNTWSIPVDVEDNNLCTPLFYAVTLKHMSIIHFLVEKRGNPNQQDIKGRSIAHCAALKGYCDVLDLIRKIGGSLTLKNKNGDLPLHEAAETGKFDVCEILLQKMSETNEIHLIDELNLSGLSPLHKASQNNYFNICKLLVAYGANVNLLTSVNTKSPDEAGMSNLSPIDLAGDEETKNLLREFKGKTSNELTKGNPSNNPKNLPNITTSVETGNGSGTTLKRSDSYNEQPKGSLTPSNKSIKTSRSLQNLVNVKEDSVPTITKSDSFDSKISKKSIEVKSEKSKKLKNMKRSKSKEKRVVHKASVEKGLAVETSDSTNPDENKNDRKLEKSVKSHLSSKPTKPVKDSNNPKKINANLKIESTSQETVTENTNRSKMKSKNKKPIEQTLNLKNESNFDNISENEQAVYLEGAEESSNPKQESETIVNIEVENQENETGERSSTISNSEESNLKPITPLDLDISSGKPVLKPIPKDRHKITEKQSKHPVSNESQRAFQERPLLAPERRPKSKRNFKPMSAKPAIDIEVIENGVEIKTAPFSNSAPDSYATTNSSSISSSISDCRATYKTKSTDLFSKVVESVREYERVRRRMRSISDQRRMEMFQGYNKAIKLDKIPIKRMTKSAKPKKTAEQSSDDIALPDLALFDPYKLQKTQMEKKRPLFPISVNKDEQIRSAYDCGSSVDTLTLY